MDTSRYSDHISASRNPLPDVDFGGTFADHDAAGTRRDFGARGGTVKGPWPHRRVDWRDAGREISALPGAAPRPPRPGAV